MKLIVALTLLLFSSTVLSHHPDFTLQAKSKDKWAMWLVACEFTPYKCSGTKLPKVVYQGMASNLNGYYRGTDTIYINRTLVGYQRRATMLHEMIHYLQAKVGGQRVPGPAEEICKAEAEAFAVTDHWWKSIGRGYKARGPKWWIPYSHCHKYYDPDYDSRDYGWW